MKVAMIVHCHNPIPVLIGHSILLRCENKQKQIKKPSTRTLCHPLGGYYGVAPARNWRVTLSRDIIVSGAAQMFLGSYHSSLLGNVVCIRNYRPKVRRWGFSAKHVRARGWLRTEPLHYCSSLVTAGSNQVMHTFTPANDTNMPRLWHCMIKLVLGYFHRLSTHS